jgi:methionyl-tRNA formyltransferase
LKDENFLQELKNLKADLQVVVAFRMLPETVWKMPPLGTFNLHASLLPQYRGAAPINWAIINGEKETGVTTFFLQHEIDTGKIIFREKISIGENDNAGDIHDKLMNIGAELVLKTVKAIESGNYTLAEQETKGELKHAPKIFKEDCKINWNKTTEEIHNLIRGLSPYPAAWTEIIDENKKTTMKIYQSEKEISKHDFRAGKILSDNKTVLKTTTSDGFINIKVLQVSGRKRIKAEEFLRGWRLSDSAGFN